MQVAGGRAHRTKWTYRRAEQVSGKEEWERDYDGQWKKQTIYNTVSLEHTVLSLSLLRRLLLPKSVVRGCHALVHPLRGHGCGAVTAERLPRLHKLQITSRSHFDVAAQAHGIHTSWLGHRRR